MRLDLARGQLGVMPLLRGELQIEEITVDGLTVNLEINAAGERNWIVVTGPRPGRPPGRPSPRSSCARRRH